MLSSSSMSFLAGRTLASLDILASLWPPVANFELVGRPYESRPSSGIVQLKECLPSAKGLLVSDKFCLDGLTLFLVEVYPLPHKLLDADALIICAESGVIKLLPEEFGSQRQQGGLPFDSGILSNWSVEVFKVRGYRQRFE